MKRRIISLILPLIFILTGLIVGVVPVVIPLAYQAENNGIIAEYSEKVSRLTEDEREEVVNEMKTYNNGGRSNFYTALDNETVISYIDIPTDSKDLYGVLYSTKKVQYTLLTG